MRRLLPLLLLLAAPAVAQWHPRDLNDECTASVTPYPCCTGADAGDCHPTLLLEALDTYVNPADNGDCTANETPYWCCTGLDTGTCDQAVSTFGTLANLTTRADDCTALDTPHDCCTGDGTGPTCAYDAPDSSNGGRGGLYCNLSIFPDGCAQRWQGIAWEGSDWYKDQSSDTPHPPIGRNLSQDDAELLGYIADCFQDGRPCIRGRPPWSEPDGADTGTDPPSQPSQDGTMEIEVGDRTWSDCTTSQEAWIVVLARAAPQDGDCDTGAANGRVSLIGYASNAQLGNDTNSGGYWLASGSSPFPGQISENGHWHPGEWHLYYIIRNGSDEVLMYEDNVDISDATPPTNTNAFAPSTQLLGCNGKNCDWGGCTETLPDGSCCGQQGQEWQGDYAFYGHYCGIEPTATDRSNMQTYIDNTYKYKDEPPWPLERGAQLP